MNASVSKPVENEALSAKKTDENRYETILDAAEVIFATSGYEGAKMRQIAETADVAQGLLHYHFGNKEKLFEMMVARRSGHINDKRAELLEALFAAEKTPDLESIIEALFRPTIEVGLSMAKDGGGFSRILVSFANSAEQREQAITERYYDPIAYKFIAALKKVEPSLSEEDAVWSYMFAIGVGMTMMAKTGRPLRLSNGACDDGDIDEMLKKIGIYICGGIRAMAAD